MCLCIMHHASLVHHAQVRVDVILVTLSLPPPDRLSQLQLFKVVGSVGTLPAVCDTFCLWIDPAVGR